MNQEEFNDKYKDYLEKGFYGLAVENEEIIEYLDSIFPIIISFKPDFQYSQIKSKFNRIAFYTNLNFDTTNIIEKKLNLIYESR